MLAVLLALGLWLNPFGPGSPVDPSDHFLIGRAVSMLWSIPGAEDVARASIDLPIWFDSVSPASWNAEMRSVDGRRMIVLAPALRDESPDALAAILAHELQHVIDQAERPGAEDIASCLADERRAMYRQVVAWYVLFEARPPGQRWTRTDTERQLQQWAWVWWNLPTASVDAQLTQHCIAQRRRPGPVQGTTP